MFKIVQNEIKIKIIKNLNFIIAFIKIAPESIYISSHQNNMFEMDPITWDITLKHSLKNSFVRFIQEFSFKNKSYLYLCGNSPNIDCIEY